MGSIVMTDDTPADTSTTSAADSVQGRRQANYKDADYSRTGYVIIVHHVVS